VERRGRQQGGERPLGRLGGENREGRKKLNSGTTHITDRG